MKVGGFPVLLIDTEEDLSILFKRLKQKQVFAFDTEFDRFRRRYGFNLLLLQIFDGDKCYLIKVNKGLNVKPFLKIFEDPNIVKVVFSGGEDVQLLKYNEAEPVNLFDLQVAAQVTNHDAKSYSALVEEVTGITLNKSHQNSNWSSAFLSEEQLIYAANDVVHSLKLYDYLTNELKKKGMELWAAAQNNVLEQVPLRHYEPKLNQRHRKQYSPLQQKMLLAMILETDRVARQLDLPPYMIMPEVTMEGFIQNKENFRGLKYAAGIYGRLKYDEYAGLLQVMDNRFIEILDGINLPALPKKERQEFTRQPELNREAYNEFKAGYKTYLDGQYGKNAADFLIAGLKDLVPKFDSLPANDMKKRLLSDYLHHTGFNLYSLIVK